MNLEEVLASIKAKGHRMTRARRAIVECFFDTRRPLTANGIREMLVGRQILVNKTTIYRELEFLKREKHIISVHLSTNEEYFESAHLDHHHHMVCTDCRKILRVTSRRLEDDINVVKDRMDESVGFRIDTHMIEFFGKCADCR